MAQQKLPKKTSLGVAIYDNLLGVDFRADQTEVERRRSPMMVNMISDLGGNPIKRDGYRRVADAYAGIVIANSESYGVRVDLTGIVIVPISIGSGESIIEEDATRAITVPNTFVFDDIVAVFGYQQYVFVMCSNGAIKADVVERDYQITGVGAGMMSVEAVGSSAPICAEIVPLSIIGMQPDATGTKGTVLYGKNVMSIYQQYSYAGDGSSTSYKIPLYSKIGAWVKVEVMDSNGKWSSSGYTATLSGTTTETAWALDGEGTETFSVANATVTISPAPPSPSSSIAGEDNVRITCAPFSMDELTMNGTTAKKGFYNETFDKLLSSQANFFFEQRLFLGVAEKTYYSEVNNLFLMPDNYWFDVDNVVVAYQRMGSNLIIITKDTGKNTIFLATQVSDKETLGDTMTTTFSVKPTNAGVGAISGNVGGILNDEPIFLSSTGIYGMLTNWSSEKYAVNRSGRVNRRLCKEPNLKDAVGCAFNSYYYLAVNGRMYILDGRHRDSTRNGENSYECYYFDSVPTIKQMFVADNRMFFTDETGTYTWNSDLPERLRYYDNLVLDQDGEFVSGDSVKAYWSSVFDDDGAPQILKTLKKKGSMCVLTPYSRTGCWVTLVKNGDEFQELGYQNTAIFSFEDVNFGYDDENNPQFIFSSNAAAFDRFTKKKIKKYKRLQIIVGNDLPEAFALTKVVKTFETGNYAKR